jgi:hypothetical protein
VQTNKPIDDNIHESFTCRLRGEIQDETKDYLVEDHNESSLGAYVGTPVNLMTLEKDYNCRWIPHDNPLCCTNNDVGELTTRDAGNELVFPYYSQRLHLLQNPFARPDWKKRHLQQHLPPVIIKYINEYLQCNISVTNFSIEKRRPCG